jgi:hypothetical protein
MKINHVEVSAEENHRSMEPTREVADEIKAVLTKYNVKTCAMMFELQCGNGRTITCGDPVKVIHYAKALAECELYEMPARSDV